MPTGRAAEFRASEETGWEGPDSAKELFYIWFKLRKQLVPTTGGNSNNEDEVFQLNSSPVEIQQNDGRTEQEVMHQTSSYEITEEDSVKKEETLEGEAVNNSKNDLSVSPAFLNHMIWPTESQENPPDERGKDSLPHAASSRAWLNYWENKEEQKIKSKETKRKRLEEREAKKLKKSCTKASCKASTSKKSSIKDWVCKGCGENCQNKDILGLKKIWVKCHTCNERSHIKCVSKRHMQQFALDDAERDEDNTFVCLSCFGGTDED